MPFTNLTNRPFNVDGLRNIPDIHTNENLIIGKFSSTFSLSSYYFQTIILINRALIEHSLKVWIRTQSLVRVKCFQSDRNQTFKTCSSSLQLLHLQHPPHCHISFHLSFHPLGTRSICYRTHAQSALFAHPNKQLFITLGLPFAPCCILHI